MEEVSKYKTLNSTTKKNITKYTKVRLQTQRKLKIRMRIYGIR